ncbi:MAG TPA: outer membrane protein assembly factor BamB [Accumulibacter sp.]|uniref:Outer membrane protein assembly factor BamB n=3 Tax=Candidatus Accumulibacter TaxID=327159 RepID=A0A080MG57_9PROT|nr:MULTISPECIES: outer membrane protein assembly factor BamB [Candidatus Accumulibacter]KFB76234.1 MAG: Outer membrane protein assembly factor BamB precursor [Candidatus Accumulibacter cognatus]MBL8402389.1 outer membrane protein assembly factor BamB [Accumulibacter sp.]MBO3709948.1 outer membrane protein assembly factor BamB [Accumulibacter sp.]MCM8580429.1 outer membrane protein assembly factor BamB [Accumulibacter sp.]MCM8622611.1 outer membrane protein assembly factor BamB [Accumulibacter 
MGYSFRAAAGLLLLLVGCSTLDALNPFSGASGPKMAELQTIQPTDAVRVLWSADIGKAGDHTFVPAVVGSSVYSAALDGTVVRLDDGQQVWKINAGKPLSGGVGADQRMVVVGTAKGELFAFATADGSLLWKARASSEIVAPPTVSSGLVIVRSGDHRLTAYDPLDGKRKWVYQRPSTPLSLRVVAGPVLIDRYVFAGFPGGKLIAVSAENGAPLWEGTVALPKGATELDRIADVTSVPVIDGRMICAVAFQGRVACFDLGNGNLIWSRDISSAAGVAIDSRYVYVSDDKGAVHALDKASGASLWKQDKLFLRRLTAPLPMRHLIAVADVKGVVHYLSRDDGSFAARQTTDGSAVRAPLQRLGSHLVVQTANGRLLVIETQ